MISVKHHFNTELQGHRKIQSGMKYAWKIMHLESATHKTAVLWMQTNFFGF
jgi:hypothetical protein